MKKLLILLLIGLGSMTTNAQTDKSPLEGKITIEVDGLACPYCAYGLEKNLKEIDGVEGIEIVINEGTALLTIAKGKQISENTVREKIKEAGFTPGTIKKESDE
ncbi:Heavy-metal-associated domain-containing protein [Gillisia sp. Hel1_33_143]|uniref:heavy-metal-associated domain-containing protein n=1 Tax=unclassified Gillisia TaxID=2615025 RepID=UPI000690512D|nr:MULTISPECIES: heavy-metal-associated domain-containing protein [unclassified Gillisia]SDR67842.1 Heavy-metal-associated domain-containing protein [Gillisia sp. Hel1_33_143]